jgi:hypothetical protein
VQPGQDIALRKYVPVDCLQMPERVSTRDEAVRAIRLCERLCTLLDNQPHCIKNDRYLIAALIQHTFTQLVPIPKPRAVDEASLRVTGRAERRRTRKGKRSTLAPAASRLQPAASAPASAAAPVAAASSRAQAGAEAERALTSEPCIWDQPITYELQVELLLELQRLTEHFGASVFSLQQDRCVLPPSPGRRSDAARTQPVRFGGDRDGGRDLRHR